MRERLYSDLGRSLNGCDHEKMALRIDHVERRSTRRIDPREEVRRIDPRAEVDTDPEGVPARAIPEPTESGRPPRPSEPDEAEKAPVSGRISVVTSVDPRLTELDPLLSSGAWGEILKVLGPPEAIEKLPPTLALIYAVALRESAGDRSATPANELAIRSMAAIYGIAPTSTTALVLAKRLLRQNPAAWRTKAAPPAKFSVLIIVVAVALGLGVGWWLSTGSHHLF
ncbi:MAG: hypothetical protein ABJE95_16375 [Byssovorax sp.]